MLKILLIFLCQLAAAAATPEVRFLEPIDRKSKPLPTYRLVPGDKLRPFLETEPARRALSLYQAAFQLTAAKGNPAQQPAAYYIALVPGGNHASIGFRIQTENGFEDHPRHAYVLLSPDADAFLSTLLHETAHVAMSMLMGGRELPRADVTSIPHSTAALSDRATAFSEGWAIHWEAIQAHYGSEPTLHKKYHRGAVLFGGGPYREDEFFRAASDLSSYSQNLARYLEVRDNSYAFEPAFQEPDYLRIQLEKARDFAALRSPNALLQSEGFHASFFFLYAIRGAAKPTPETVAARHQQMLTAIQAMGDTTKFDENTPWLLEFIDAYARLFPTERRELLTAFTDASHGAFSDPAAPKLWRDHYLAVLRLDLKSLNRDAIMALRKQWVDAALNDTSVLRRLVVPQIPCLVPAAKVHIVAFGDPEPLLFDINTAPRGILRLAHPPSADAWLSARATQPFQSLADLESRLPAAKGLCRKP